MSFYHDFLFSAINFHFKGDTDNIYTSWSVTVTLNLASLFSSTDLTVWHNEPLIIRGGMAVTGQTACQASNLLWYGNKLQYESREIFADSHLAETF